MDLISLLKDFGVPVALVVFFIIQGKFREERMERRLDSLEEYNRTQLVELFERSNAVIQENAKVMGRLDAWLERKFPGGAG